MRRTTPPTSRHSPSRFRARLHFDFSASSSKSFLSSSSSLSSPSSSSPPPPPGRDAIRISVPVQSTWVLCPHFHPSERTLTSIPSGATFSEFGCESVTCLSGFCYEWARDVLTDGGMWLVQAGKKINFKPGYGVCWGRDRHRNPPNDQVPLEAELVANHVLWRNVCSAILDRAIFPQLGSTPWWLKVLFALLPRSSRMRDRLLDFMLWVQLRVIFYARDTYLYHGFIMFTFPWIMWPFGTAPQWARRLQGHSFNVIALVVMTMTYWIGIVFLGMKGEYAECTPTGKRGEKKG